MKKLNKKGFTLVEMLVVIAIIAVLVAIIVPTTSSATNKAKASANAANLRSVLAEIGIALLNEDVDASTTSITYSDGVVTVKGTTGDGTKITVPAGKTVDDMTAAAFTFEIDSDTKDITVKYGGKDINDFATYAETGDWPAT